MIQFTNQVQMIDLSKIKSVATSSSRRYGKKEEKHNIYKSDIHYQEFIENCEKYGLSPEFYETECFTDDGKIFYLKGFIGNSAKIMSSSGVSTVVPFETAIEMMKTFIKMETKEIAPKMRMLGIDKHSVRGKKIKEELGLQKRRKMSCLTKALKVFNGNFENALEEMGLPDEMFRAGCLNNEGIYEFVSFRQDHPQPYVLENISKRYDDPSRFRFVSFKTLKNEMAAYAMLVNNEKMLKDIENMKPVAINDSDLIKVVNVNRKQEDVDQYVFVVA